MQHMTLIIVVVFLFANITFLPGIWWAISHRTLIPNHIKTFFIILRRFIKYFQKITSLNFIDSCKSDSSCRKLISFINLIIIKKALFTKCFTLFYDFYSFILFYSPFLLVCTIKFIIWKVSIWNISFAYNFLCLFI